MFSRLIPNCSKCIHFKFGGVSKNHNLGMCMLFKFEGHPFFAEMARMEPTKCGVEGLRFERKMDNSDLPEIRELYKRQILEINQVKTVKTVKRD